MTEYCTELILLLNEIASYLKEMGERSLYDKSDASRVHDALSPFFTATRQKDQNKQKEKRQSKMSENK